MSVTVEEKTERKNVECAEGKVIKIDFAIASHEGNQGGNQNPPPVTEEKKTMFPPPTGAIITGVIGLVGVGLGIGFGVASSNANSENLTRGTTAGGVCRRTRTRKCVWTASRRALATDGCDDIDDRLRRWWCRARDRARLVDRGARKIVEHRAMSRSPSSARTRPARLSL